MTAIEEYLRGLLEGHLIMEEKQIQHMRKLLDSIKEDDHDGEGEQ